MDGAAIGAADQAFQLSLLLLDEADQDGIRVFAGLLGSRLQSPGHQAGQRAGNGTLFHNHAVLQRGLIANVNHAGDARAHRRNFAGLAVAEADAVHLLAAVITEAQDVAVAGKPLAQAVGERQSQRFRTQQNLRGTERARAQHDDIRGNEHVGSVEIFAAFIERLIVNEPLTAAPFDVAHRNLREDLRAEVPGVGQIVHQRSILSAEIAAGHAIAAHRAGVLRYTHVIDLGFEGHVNGCPIEILLQIPRRFFQCAHLG